MNEIIDLTIICPSKDMLKCILSLVNKILFNFVREYKLLIAEAEDMQMEVFCSLTNSSIRFFSTLRAFENRVTSFGIMTEEDVALVIKK